MKATAGMMTVKCCDKATVLGYTWFAPGCEGTLFTCRVHLRGHFLLRGLRCFCCRSSACSWESWLSCAAPWELTEPWKWSLKMVKFLKVQQKDHGSHLHCTNKSGFLNKASVLHWCKELTETAKDKSSSILHPHLPLFKENTLSCVYISFSVFKGNLDADNLVGNRAFSK